MLASSNTNSERKFALQIVRILLILMLKILNLLFTPLNLIICKILKISTQTLVYEQISHIGHTDNKNKKKHSLLDYHHRSCCSGFVSILGLRFGKMGFYLLSLLLGIGIIDWHQSLFLFLQFLGCHQLVWHLLPFRSEGLGIGGGD